MDANDKDILKDHYIGTGTRITDTVANAVYEIKATSVEGLTLQKAKAIGTSVKTEFITYKTLQTDFATGTLKIQGYEQTDADKKILHLAIKTLIEEHTSVNLRDQASTKEKAEAQQAQRERIRKRTAIALNMDLEMGEEEGN